MAGFVGKLLSHDDFMEEMAAFSGRIALHAACNALSETLLRLTVPGIPDTYQGAELWNQSLVDPDNRRPVDFALRRKMLGHIEDRLDDSRALARDLDRSRRAGRAHGAAPGWPAPSGGLAGSRLRAARGA